MKSSYSLELNSIYSRKELQNIFSITDATINNGIFQPKGHSSIWIFVTKNKTPDKTNYYDDFDGEILNFEGQTKGRTDYKITEHSEAGNELLVFYRDNKLEYPNYSFKYLGKFEYISHSGNAPKMFSLQAKDIGLIDSGEIGSIQDMMDKEDSREGKEKTRIQTYYERNPKLRAKALKLHGTTCKVCGFNFSEIYGKYGEGYIEIHHIFPLSSYKKSELVNPMTDLVPLCSNCHRMIHRKKQLLSIDELKKILETQFTMASDMSCHLEDV